MIRFLVVTLILSLWGAVVALAVGVDRQRPASVRAAELSYLPKGEYLRLAVLGYREIAADLIWLGAVQHFGTRKQTEQGYRWAYHAVDVATDLDPQFWFAYLAAGTILGVWAEMPHESIAILTKGIRHNPERWQLPFTVGYDYYYELRDPVMAAEYLRMASILPGSPPYLPRLAARMTVQAGDPNAALEFLVRFRDQVKDERLRMGLERRMKEVIAERDIQRLEQAVQRFRGRYGRKPGSLNELVAKGIVAEIPTEPLGGEYRLDVSSGSVSSTGLVERLRIHQKYRGSRKSRK